MGCAYLTIYYSMLCWLQRACSVPIGQAQSVPRLGSMRYLNAFLKHGKEEQAETFPSDRHVLESFPPHLQYDLQQLTWPQVEHQFIRLQWIVVVKTDKMNGQRLDLLVYMCCKKWLLTVKSQCKKPLRKWG